MLTPHQIFVLNQAWIPAVLLLVVSFIYWLLAEQETALSQAAVSVHPLFPVFAVLYAAVISPWVPKGEVPFVAFLPWVIFAAAYIRFLWHCLIRYEGARGVHILQVVAVPCALMCLLMGAAFITEDWH